MGADLLRTGRRIRDAELTSLAHPEPEPVRATVDAATPLVSWNPVTLRREALASVRRPEPGGYQNHLDLAPLESVVLVDDHDGRLPVRSATPLAELGADGAWELTLPGHAPIRLEHGPVPWTDGSRRVRYVGTYACDVDVDSAFLRGRRILAAFDDVADIARVIVNGVDCGITWTAPFEADITEALRPGLNAVVVEVANAWINRLIAEARHPTGEIFAPRRRLRTARRDLAVGPERSRRAPGLRPRPAWPGHRMNHDELTTADRDRIEGLLRSMTWDEKLAQMQVASRPIRPSSSGGSGGRRGDLLAAQRRRGQCFPAGRRRTDPAGHPAAGRLGRHSRSAHHRPDAASDGRQLRPRCRRAHRPARRGGGGVGRGELESPR